MKLAIMGGGALLVAILALEFLVRDSVGRGQERQAREAREAVDTSARCREGHVWVRAYPQSYCAAGYVP